MNHLPLFTPVRRPPDPPSEPLDLRTPAVRLRSEQPPPAGDLASAGPAGAALAGLQALGGHARPPKRPAGNDGDAAAHPQAAKRALPDLVQGDRRLTMLRSHVDAMNEFQAMAQDPAMRKLRMVDRNGVAERFGVNTVTMCKLINLDGSLTPLGKEEMEECGNSGNKHARITAAVLRDVQSRILSRPDEAYRSVLAECAKDHNVTTNALSALVSSSGHLFLQAIDMCRKSELGIERFKRPTAEMIRELTCSPGGLSSEVLRRKADDWGLSLKLLHAQLSIKDALAAYSAHGRAHQAGRDA